jgi:glycosyltransferase involved in cell wall biosynthesis
MQVLIITGDKNFKPGHPRFDLQASAVSGLRAVYWGRGALIPHVPPGRFAVVSVQDPFARGLVAWVIARFLGAALNVQVHADLGAQSFSKRMMAHFVLHRADSVRAVSQSIKEQVERMGVRAPVAVLPVFVDVAKFKALQRRPHRQKTILWLGRFEPEKDPLRALSVLREVRAKTNARLVMLGKGSLEAVVRKEAADLPVELPGWQDVAPYFMDADVVLCTSHQEGWGASIVEALAAGVPVVAPDVGIAREAGATVVPPEQLAEAVVEVLQNALPGHLALSLPNAQAWAAKWRATLSV